jgi:hypothetical protein
MLFKELKKEEGQTSLKASQVYNGVLSRKQLETSTEKVQSRLYIYLFIVLYTFLVLVRISKYWDSAERFFTSGFIDFFVKQLLFIPDGQA